MPKLADHIEVTADSDGKFSLVIDGTEFPWHITTDGVSTSVTTDGVPTVTMTLIAERVSVEHAMWGARIHGDSAS